jgi:hypothetical protein
MPLDALRRRLGRLGVGFQMFNILLPAELGQNRQEQSLLKFI